MRKISLTEAKTAMKIGERSFQYFYNIGLPSELFSWLLTFLNLQILHFERLKCTEALSCCLLAVMPNNAVQRHSEPLQFFMCEICGPFQRFAKSNQFLLHPSLN